MAGSRRNGPGSPTPYVEMSFRREWRPYQARVLAALESHLADQRIHVVAAPGSGKTTLGIEIVRRLGLPALVLSPTRIIRDQWLARLGEFLPQGVPLPDWAGSDLERPSLYTSVTYQALHRNSAAEAATAEPDEEARDAPPSAAALGKAAALLAEAGVRVLVLDEAHHLRQEWWKALSSLAKGIPDVHVVALTATPPYDVTGLEWRRYQELCGTIDEEISVPELVRAGTLAPHQDYVWVVPPSPEEADFVKGYDERVQRLLDDLEADADFRACVLGHRWLGPAPVDEAAVLDDPELAVGLLVLAKMWGAEGGHELRRLLGIAAEELPAPSRRWWQVVLEAFARDEGWGGDQRTRKRVAARLKAEGLSQRGELLVERSRLVLGRLSMSPSKLQACVDIHRLESALRGDGLRQVVLTDFIRDDEPGTRGSAVPSLGAWPVFQHLVSSSPPEASAGFALLTGRVAILPERVAERAALACSRLRLAPVPRLHGFVRVEEEGAKLVPLFTRLLGQGDIKVLVGTRALLGEGWDAPSINSLVLASYVGSYVLSNQMRGRAIRRDPAAPGKAASVWHVVAVDPSTRSGHADYDELCRRFRMFVGLHHREAVIESGIERLGLRPFRSVDDMRASNDEATSRHRETSLLGQRWQDAIKVGSEGKVAPVLSLPKPPRYAALMFTRTLGYLLATGCALAAQAAAQVMRGAGRTDADGALRLLFAAILFGLVVSLPSFLKALWIWLRHLPVDGSIREAGLAVMEGLCSTDLIKTHRDRLSVGTEPNGMGGFRVRLDGADYYETSLFTDCLEELLSPIDNPRYLVTRTGRAPWGGVVRDYHAVPAPLAETKDLATRFHTAWSRRFGSGPLIYTRSQEGRRVLLEARARAFSAAFADKNERRDRWQ